MPERSRSPYVASTPDNSFASGMERLLMATMQKWIAIAAMARNRVIGNSGKIPWHISDEFRWFKSRTMGGVLVMGRKTYESIGRPLPGRETVVISRAGQEFKGTQTLRSLEELAEKDFSGKEIFIAGGAEIYGMALPRCSVLLLSVIDLEPLGDVLFPEFESGFDLVGEVMNHPQFRVLEYRNKNLA